MEQFLCYSVKWPFFKDWKEMDTVIRSIWKNGSHFERMD